VFGARIAIDGVSDSVAALSSFLQSVIRVLIPTSRLCTALLQNNFVGSYFFIAEHRGSLPTRAMPRRDSVDQKGQTTLGLGSFMPLHQYFFQGHVSLGDLVACGRLATWSLVSNP